ncbi:Sulfotransferase family protein [Aquimixticola soesokkakensis]|uniref:Sulfotransferase family protein n=1 Tax=Aquimixticola soesokkakensis TaxID=1519096 RepID=A0A1Y5SGB0_9RHOB|nr:sulfotransferase family 2 domain-containing protein [Aquimixticola soesokkakensis]SLN39464.1 Sulfotransferase family protein [Aquimixticola soesokkakensis]
MGVYLPDHHIHYMATPKVACTSVKAALAQIAGKLSATEAAKVDNLWLHKTYPTRRFWENRDRKRQPDEWRFCVVRDPVARLLSLWLDKVAGAKDMANSRKLNAQSELPLTPDPDFFFENLRRYMDLSSVIKSHALPQKVFIGLDLSDYDALYRTSALGELAQDLSERAGKQIVLPRLNSTSARLEFQDLGLPARRAVLAHLEADYALLKDHYTAPALVSAKRMGLVKPTKASPGATDRLAG